MGTVHEPKVREHQGEPKYPGAEQRLGGKFTTTKEAEPLSSTRERQPGRYLNARRLATIGGATARF